MKNYKKIMAVAAFLLGIQAVSATDITGVTGVNGVFNIDPTAINGDVGIRQFENFNLSAGDIANLIYKYGIKDISTFVNLVDNKINIDGIVNTVRDGKFHNGHAVFISPNGMVVGASGVLNVGSLSILTPTEDKYKDLTNNPRAFDLSQIKDKSNADVELKGQIFSRGNVDIAGKNVTISNYIYNGKNLDMVANNSDDIRTLVFNSLVNYDEAAASEKTLDVVDGNIIIRSGGENGKISTSALITNLNKGDIIIENANTSGNVEVGGIIENLNGGNIKLTNNGAGLDVNGVVFAKDSNAIIKNTKGGLNISSNGNISTNNGDLRVVNTGDGGMAVYGNLIADGETALIKNTKGDLFLYGNLDLNTSKAKQIINTAKVDSNTTIMGDVNSTGKAGLYIKSTADGGILINSKIKNYGSDSVVIDNRNGDLLVSGLVESEKNISLANSGNMLSVTKSGKLSGNGDIVLKNNGTGNTSVFGQIHNAGDAVSIIGENSSVEIYGTIKNSGNIGIKSRGDGLNIRQEATVESLDGDLLVQNLGKDGMNVYGDVKAKNKLSLVNNKGSMGTYANINASDVSIANKNKGSDIGIVGGTINANNIGIQSSSKLGLELNGDLSAKKSLTVINEAGDLKHLANTVSQKDVSIQNSGDGQLYIASDSSISGKGKVVVLNKAKNGMLIDGIILNDGEVMSVTNKNGDLVINGKVQSINGNLGIVNKDNAGTLKTSDKATIINDNGKTNIINASAGGMDLDGSYTTTGELNLVNDNGEGFVKADIKAGKLNTFSRRLSKGLHIISEEENENQNPELGE